jgi:HK97 family phage portal protein
MSIFGITEKRSETLSNPGSFLTGVFGGRGTDAGLMVSEQTALTYTTVYACVQVIAEAIGVLPLNLYQRKGDGAPALVEDTAIAPIASLLNAAPNDEMGSMSFKATEMGWTLTWGNGYAEIERNNAGFPIALHPIAPNRVVPRRRQGMRAADCPIEYWITRTAMMSPYVLEQPIDAVDAIIPKDDMFHLAGLGYDGIIGYSPVAMAREAVGLGLAAQAYGSRFFGNNSTPSGVLQTKGKVKDPEALKAQWEAANAAGNQRRTAVLEYGMTWNQIGIPPEDSQFLETRKFQRSEVCGIYRVPPHMVGDLDRSTNNNIEHQGMDFVTYCLLGWLTRWEQEANRKLLTKQQRAMGYFYRFDADELMRGDMKTRYEAYQIARNSGWMNANQILAKEHAPAQAGEQGEIYLVPMNMMDQRSLLEPGKSIDPAKVRSSFRALLADSAGRVVKKEISAARRAAKDQGTFAQSMRAFYRDHADYIELVMAETASSLGDMVGAPFPTVRAGVRRLAKESVARAMGELAAPAVDVEAVATQWDAVRPGQMADALLKEIGL